PTNVSWHCIILFIWNDDLLSTFDPSRSRSESDRYNWLGAHFTNSYFKYIGGFSGRVRSRCTSSSDRLCITHKFLLALGPSLCKCHSFGWLREFRRNLVRGTAAGDATRASSKVWFG